MVFQQNIESNDVKQNTDEMSGDVILGDLLFYLRENKLMSTLMSCRQIDKIIVSKEICELSSEFNDLTDLVTNEKHKFELDKFFKSKGLGFKIQEKNKEKSKVDLLSEFFGDKLIVQ